MTRRQKRGPLGRCRWCHDPILWLPNLASGRLAPINASPEPGGNVLLIGPPGNRLGYRVLGGDERDAADPTHADLDAQPLLHVNHWATCPSVRAARRPPPPIGCPTPGTPPAPPADVQTALF